ncbi:Gfo/Idh/MocA family oxidoreductase [Fodinibius sediminis]|uniref:Predicted dehydrogenase n=1 Tax=Fodinibius sediminis TaxID=1214077 RepID=A0A521DPR7_9BACT|nr:Gfo/Idh/MocA family oxidoreductase [Fodinibius sediminis]SMO72910.1 Predicted dehydrogenase [Fodinibius sediminis]
MENDNKKKTINHTGISRRDFIKKTGKMAGGGLFLGSLPIQASAYVGATATIKVGVIGCGGRGTGAANQALMADPGVKVVALADLFKDRIDKTHETLSVRHSDKLDVPEERKFVGLDAYKKAIEVSDVVLIANAAKFHPLHMKTAIEAGKHVFVEKPHAIDPAGIKVVSEALEMAEQKGLCLVSGLQNRFNAGRRETIRRIQEGQIGEITSIEENWLRGPYGNTSRPTGMTEMEIQFGNQYRFSWLSGDDVTQSLVHNLDRATWVMGEIAPEYCTGMGGRSGAQDLLGNVFDHNSVVYHYGNGVRLYANCRTTQSCYNEHSSIVKGTKGTAYLLNNRITGENPWEYEQEVSNPYQEEHNQLFKAIRNDEPIISDYMARSTLVAIMGQLSCYSGKKITWEEAVNSDYFLAPAVEECRMDMEPPIIPDENGVYPVCAQPGITSNI